MPTLSVNEIFYSIQGEGNRVGTANVFIRLAKCNLSCSFCDTDFETFNVMTLYNIAREIAKYNCNNIIWTGGEPAMQLNVEVVDYFKRKGYYQAIETNGMFDVPYNLDWVTVAPKNKKIKLLKASEVKYLVKAGSVINDLGIEAEHYYLCPINEKSEINNENLAYCIKLIKENPKWKLSYQAHKVWKTQ